MSQMADSSGNRLTPWYHVLSSSKCKELVEETHKTVDKLKSRVGKRVQYVQLEHSKVNNVVIK